MVLFIAPFSTSSRIIVGPFGQKQFATLLFPEASPLRQTYATRSHEMLLKGLKGHVGNGRGGRQKFAPCDQNIAP